MAHQAIVTLSADAKSGFSPSPSFFKLHIKLPFTRLYRFVVVTRQQLRFNTCTGQMCVSNRRLIILENVFADQRPQIGSSVEDAVFLKQKRSAFVFITTEIDESHLALEDLRKLDAVDEVYLSRGAYDLVAKVSGDSLEFLREEVLRQIRNLSSIKSTLTLTVI
jgi:DNA-binding Lrp family transcriptional regulator